MSLELGIQTVFELIQIEEINNYFSATMRFSILDSDVKRDVFWLYNDMFFLEIVFKKLSYNTI